MQDPQNTQLIASVVAIVVVVLVLSFRMRKMRRKTPLKLKRLWIGPAILLLMAGITLTQFPPAALDWVWLVLALGAGAGLGWQRARLMSIMVDPADRSLSTQATPMAIYFLIGLVLLRSSLRAGLRFESGLSPNMVNDIFVVFAAGLFVAQSVELGLRARRLLGAEPMQAGTGRQSDKP
jgi:multisubunit Na+/H+ antiporter MnhB subunit